MEPRLIVAMYHYVRDLQRTPFPALKAMELDAFRAQVTRLREQFEMASLESALAYLRGQYRPPRSLCLLTFDDGLKEHAREVAPLLAEHGIAGLFFVITSCVEERRVAPVHMNHFLTAGLGFETYSRRFLDRLAAFPDAPSLAAVEEERVRRTYRWDPPEVGAFKYLFNFQLPVGIRDRIVRELFVDAFGEEAAFSDALYLNWEEAREMQAAGMALGGHSHAHRSLGSLSDAEQTEDLARCREALAKHLRPQSHWPFCYPYGKRDSFNGWTVARLRGLGYDCAFSTEVGDNAPGADAFALHRFDCKDL